MNKIKLYDTSIFIGYISKEYALENVKSGFIKKITEDVYVTDMEKMGNEVTKWNKIMKKEYKKSYYDQIQH